jgi:two-component system alkaline phosphatase synthesis response regulator PhoP
MLTVLIVDDQSPILELVRYTLEGEHVRVVEATDGTAALEAARAACPDLVLLDVHMPGLDGLEVCRRLRQDPRLRRMRIVMLTAAAQQADRVQGYAAGADEYLAKPFSPLALLALVRTLLPEPRPWPER